MGNGNRGSSISSTSSNSGRGRCRGCCGNTNRCVSRSRSRVVLGPLPLVLLHVLSLLLLTLSGVALNRLTPPVNSSYDNSDVIISDSNFYRRLQHEHQWVFHGVYLGTNQI